MLSEYTITYKTKNKYKKNTKKAYWQFLIIPETNDSQELVSFEFSNSENILYQNSINGYGFLVFRVHSTNESFNKIYFEANFKVIKKYTNLIDYTEPLDITKDYNKLEDVNFKIDYNTFLTNTQLTTLPLNGKSLFNFNKKIAVLDNLTELNKWTNTYLSFKKKVTNTKTTLKHIIKKKQGVCQDFTHLFCAIARANQIPARYVSGYLNQTSGYLGDSQMHAWAEVFVPNIGWVGFDPTNNLLVTKNHIKVCHGKDYKDCSPLKGIIHTKGDNITKHSVQVIKQQPQQ